MTLSRRLEGAALDDGSDAGEPPLVSVVIPTYNRSARCARLLRMLAEQTLGPRTFEVIVVDDCSPDDTADVVRALIDELPYRLELLRSDVNGGAGPARNIGWRACRAEIVAFIDDDVVPQPEWLEAGLAVFADRPGIGLVQGRTNASDPDALKAKRWAYTVKVQEPGPHFESCNIFYRRAAIEAAGGFGVEYSWWSSAAWCEDTLAGWSAIEAGWESDFANDAVVTHDVEYRDLKWWVKTSLSQYRQVDLAARFPDYRRRAFWRPWAPTPYDAAFVVGAIGMLGAVKWRPLALAALPYIACRRPSVRQGEFLRGCVETVLIDSARTVGNVYGSVRSRIFVV